MIQCKQKASEQYIGMGHQNYLIHQNSNGGIYPPFYKGETMLLDHFINDFLDKCPSGRYRTVKYRGASGRDCFLRHILHTLNSILYYTILYYIDFTRDLIYSILSFSWNFYQCQYLQWISQLFVRDCNKSIHPSNQLFGVVNCYRSGFIFMYMDIENW